MVLDWDKRRLLYGEVLKEGKRKLKRILEEAMLYCKEVEEKQARKHERRWKSKKRMGKYALSRIDYYQGPM